MSTSRTGRWARRAAAAAFVLAVAGWTGWSLLTRPAATPAMRGRAVAERLGCYACHGPGGVGGVPNPGSEEAEVPAWDGGSVMMYVEKESEIREWILHGHPARLAGRHSSKALIHMPAYEGRLGAAELDDLVAWFKAVSDHDRPDTPEARTGRELAARLGCFGCHGPGGRGGSPNPGSFKGYIPPWDGADFAELVRDDGELREWILEGTPARLASHPIASHFVTRQVVKMPAFRDRLKADELEALVAYIRWLRREPSSK